jgi:hypothetical protein
LRWGDFPQLKELDDEESRRRHIKEVVVEKILRNDVFFRLREMDAKAMGRGALENNEGNELGIPKFLQPCFCP